MNNSAWKSRSTKVETPWGFEVRWNALAGMITGKTLHIKRGHRTSFKYYNIKDEVLYVYSGKARISYADRKFLDKNPEHPMNIDIFEPGDCLNIQSGCPYRIEAIDDCIIIEIGNRGADSFVRLLDDYGRECSEKGDDVI